MPQSSPVHPAETERIPTLMSYHIYTSPEQFAEDNRALGAGLPFADSASVLAQPLSVAGKTVPNRLACQAMEGCDGSPDGSPSELTVRRYLRLAQGGAGLIWFEATAVLPEGRANPHQLMISPRHTDALLRLTDSIRQAALHAGHPEPLIILQATHSGRYSKPEGVPAPLIACHNPHYEAATPIPDERIVSDDYLKHTGEALAGAARLAERAGFDGIDIKCCHRYLLSELLSARTRPRPYGGDLENRTRLLRESIMGARQSCGSGFLVTSRLNIYDGLPYPYGFGVSADPEAGDGAVPAFDPAEPEWLLSQLYRYGVRLVNLTMGNPYVNPHVNRPYAKGSYPEPEHPLCGVARMLHGTAVLKHRLPKDMRVLCSALSFLGVAAPRVAAGLIENGDCDLAGFGRTAFAYPGFAEDILTQGCMKKEKCCLACSACTEIMRAGGTTGCVIRDASVYAPIYRRLCVPSPQ